MLILSINRLNLAINLQHLGYRCIIESNWPILKIMKGENMKLKKVLAVLFTSVLILTFSTPAYGATGVADTKDKALSLIPGNSIQLFISNSQDQDWYVYTNNSGEAGYFFAYITPQDSQNFVITSYSIHYTKLYEVATLPIGISSFYYVTSGFGFNYSCLNASSGNGSAILLTDTYGVNFLIVRITSYNVCYTKLLRFI